MILKKEGLTLIYQKYNANNNQNFPLIGVWKQNKK
jgi:hypothetical protein